MNSRHAVDSLRVDVLVATLRHEFPEGDISEERVVGALKRHGSLKAAHASLIAEIGGKDAQHSYLGTVTRDGFIRSRLLGLEVFIMRLRRIFR